MFLCNLFVWLFNESCNPCEICCIDRCMHNDRQTLDGKVCLVGTMISVTHHVVFSFIDCQFVFSILILFKCRGICFRHIQSDLDLYLYY